MEFLTKQKEWKILGAVETIYEEEEDYDEEEDSSSNPESPPTPFQFSSVKAWSEATGNNSDVSIHVHELCFHLHKGPLVARSGYLKRHLTESSEITLSPPLNITPATFILVVDFCYGVRLSITPQNITALLTAAELLEMVDGNGKCHESLRQKTEFYFCRTVSVNREYTCTVLRSCLTLLPEAEMEARLVSRCIEALCLVGDEDDVLDCLVDLKNVPIKDFRLIAEAIHTTGSHDLLYRIIDFYLKEQNGKITEEEKIKLCNYIDCNILTPESLMHAIQNPKMPLRFIVQAMFIEQLNTRRSIYSAATQLGKNYKIPKKDEKCHDVTLGAILQRDSALRQVDELQAAMDATSSRIQTLEAELSGMRLALIDAGRNESDPGRSISFRVRSGPKVERGERGSVSSGNFQCRDRKERAEMSVYSRRFSRDSKVDRNLGKRILNGLKSVFRGSNVRSEKELYCN